MKTWFVVIAFLGTGLVMTGCSISSGSYVLRRKADRRIGSFTEIFISRPKALPSNVAEHVTYEIPRRFAEKLCEKGIFEEIIAESADGAKFYSNSTTCKGAEVNQSGQTPPGMLLCEATILEFNPGSQAKGTLSDWAQGRVG